jgi:hypothetical protein
MKISSREGITESQLHIEVPQPFPAAIDGVMAKLSVVNARAPVGALKARRPVKISPILGTCLRLQHGKDVQLLPTPCFLSRPAGLKLCRNVPNQIGDIVIALPFQNSTGNAHQSAPRLSSELQTFRRTGITISMKRRLEHGASALVRL